MKKLQPFISYIKFLAKAKSSRGFGIHSPFVFDLLTTTFNQSNDEILDEIISWHRSLYKRKENIETGKYGAGSRRKKSQRNRIGEIALRTGIPPRYGRLLYNFAREGGFRTIFELGTGIGISTAYLQRAVPDAYMVTIEGSTQKSRFAQNEFLRLQWPMPEFIMEDFDVFLEKYPRPSHPFLAYIDGNHSYEPTLKYFRRLLEYSREDTVMIFDDIHWSADMEKAWSEICRDSRVSITIDSYFMGWVFFRKGISKQDFVIRL